MKLSNNYLPRQIGNRYFLIPVGQATVEGREIMELNRSGYDIVTSLLEDKSFDELLDDMATKYEAEPSEIASLKKLLAEYITKLLEFNNLLTNC